VTVQADVAVATDVECMVTQVLDRFGQIDVLVNNATLHRGRRVHRLPESEWDTVLDSCLKGAYHCCQQVVPHMSSAVVGALSTSPLSLGSWAGQVTRPMALPRPG
jgi:3-oxoacyl-[acyl-carrier protein] reductase